MVQLWEIDMEASPSSISKARSFVGATLEAWGLEPLVDTATLLTSELATNALLHARTSFRVTVILDGVLTVEVADGSVDLPVAGELDPASDRGRGLVIVSRMADRWGTRPAERGKTVWFSLDLA